MPNPRKYESIATELGKEVSYLTAGVVVPGSKRTVDLVGYVGEGGHILPMSNAIRGAAPAQVEAPPGINIEVINAVRVDTDTMVPAYHAGNIIYYGERETDPRAALGAEVVACLSDDTLVIRRLARGRKAGHFDLVAYNGTIVEDHPVKWVARILWVKKG